MVSNPKKKALNHDEVFAPVARIEAIRLFFGLCIIYGTYCVQMDVKSSFVYGTIEEEMYVCQPPSFEDPQFLDTVYKVEKALYGLHQAPRAWYVVPAGKVIIIVSPGRLSLVPTGRVLSPGSDNESDDASVHSEATIAQQQQNIQPQIITTVSNNNAKFPYLKKDEYEVWAMKMEYWITNNDMNIWKVNTLLSEESRQEIYLALVYPVNHVADFHSMDDAKSIWNAVKSRLVEICRIQEDEKSILKQEFFRSQAIMHLLVHSLAKDVSVAASPSYSLSYLHCSIKLKDWVSQICYAFCIVYNKLSEAGRKIDFDKKESARFNKKKVRCYKCLQRGHFARECRAKGGNDKQRYSSFKIQEIGKKEEDSKALITVDTLVDWTEHDGQSDGVIAPKEFGMIAGCDTEDAIEEGAAKIYNLITGADTKEASTAGWDDSAFSVFTTNSEKVKGRPLFNRFAKTDSMKAVPPPLSGDYTPLSDHIDLDESQMSYGTKSSTSGDFNSVSNDFVSYDNSDKSSEVNINDFASCDSSVKSSEPKSNDSTSCASTSSVSTSESEA
ncbi:ribonuclease H-like domain-containing protein [Tanacetum coccineum]